MNKQRILSYLDRLVLLPKKSAAAVDVTQVSVSKAFPVVNEKSLEPARKITKEDKEVAACATLRKAWADQHFAGVRAKRAAKKAEASEIKEKK